MRHFAVFGDQKFVISRNVNCPFHKNRSSKMMSRTGSPYFDQKKKRWVGRVMFPADPVTGKRKFVRRFGMTEAEVRKKSR